MQSFLVAGKIFRQGDKGKSREIHFFAANKFSLVEFNSFQHDLLYNNLFVAFTFKFRAKNISSRTMKGNAENIKYKKCYINNMKGSLIKNSLLICMFYCAYSTCYDVI